MLKKRLIIVDDDPIITEVAKVSLNKERYDIFATNIPEIALEEYYKNPTSLVVTDLNMPNISGLELISEIKNSNPLPLILVLTSFTEKKSVENLVSQNFIFDYILKPFSREDFANKINKAFEFVELHFLESIN